MQRRQTEVAHRGKSDDKNIHRHTYIQAHTHTYTHTNTHTHIYIYIYIYICMHICIYIQTHTDRPLSLVRKSQQRSTTSHTDPTALLHIDCFVLSIVAMYGMKIGQISQKSEDVSGFYGDKGEERAW